MPKSAKKAQKKLTLEAIGEEFRRSVGVITEDLEGKVDLVLEQHGDIMKKLEGHDKRFDVVDKQLGVIATTQGGHTEMIGKVATDLTIVKEQVEIISSGLKKKVDYQEFESLQRRVTALEKIRK